MALESLIDLDRYPLADPASARYREILETARAELAARGCSVLRGFIRPTALEAMAGEARELAPLANENRIESNAYSTRRDPSLPAEHPVNLFMERSNAFVAKESIPARAALRRLYHAAGFHRFIADCMERETIHEYADPFAGLVINVLHPGCQHPWHYDTNEFIASALLQPAEQGGVFEYCPNIRRPGDEQYRAVSDVIRGVDRSRVRRLELRLGDLQLFRGRFSLHRVTRVGGARPRLAGIFAYADEPGVIGKPERTRQLFGRVSQAHLSAQRRADGLLD